MVIPSSCSSSNYFTKTVVKNKELVIARTEFLNTTKGSSVNRKFVLARIDNWRFPICIYKIDDNTFHALLMECTHRSCELSPHGDFLICPCHGSEFDRTGKVQNPPAEENLKTYKIHTDKENIYVQLF